MPASRLACVWEPTGAGLGPRIVDTLAYTAQGPADWDRTLGRVYTEQGRESVRRSA